jgi:hypothetical protein
MALFLQLPFYVQETALTLDALSKTGVGAVLPDQCGALGLYAIFASTGVPPFGAYQMFLETRISGAAEWTDTGEIFPIVSAAGVYKFAFSSPVLDEVRIRVEGTNTVGAVVQFTWLADVDGLTLST